MRRDREITGGLLEHLDPGLVRGADELDELLCGVLPCVFVKFRNSFWKTICFIVFPLMECRATNILFVWADSPCKLN